MKIPLLALLILAAAATPAVAEDVAQGAAHGEDAEVGEGATVGEDAVLGQGAAEGQTPEAGPESTYEDRRKAILRDQIERSVVLIEEGQYALARTYLDPALIDWRLSREHRSGAYYYRGFSFFAEDHYVSALRDYNRAVEFNPSNPAALAALGHLHLSALGTPRDLELAVELFRKAANLGHVGAQFQLGYAYLEGLGIEQDVVAARGWLLDASDQGNAAAMMHLARSYRTGLAEEPDPDTAEQWYRRAYEAGLTDALVSLAYMHRQGEFGDPDGEAAMALLEQAVADGSAAAQVTLGHIYLTGEMTGEMTGQGTAQDVDRARRLFELSAAQGNPAGLLGLAHLYQVGEGGVSDPEQAEALYRQASVQGLLPAQMRLAYVLLGKKTPAARAEAIHWLEQAASQNSPQAMNDYAWLLATSPEAEVRNAQQALSFARLAVAEVPSAAYLDTLAAAYAEDGQFAEAARVQQQAIDALAPEEQALAGDFEVRLGHYQQEKPWRE